MISAVSIYLEFIMSRMRYLKLIKNVFVVSMSVNHTVKMLLTLVHCLNRKFFFIISYRYYFNVNFEE